MARRATGLVVQSCLLVLAGCPSRPAPLPGPVTTESSESEEPAIEPRELLGTWSVQAWQVDPGGQWQDAEAAAFAVALRESNGEDVRSLDPVPMERLAEFPSVTVELTVAEEQLAVPGIEGAMVRIIYREPDGPNDDEPPRAVLFEPHPDGGLLLDCGIDEIRVIAVNDDRVEIEGRLRGSSTDDLVLTRQPDPSGQ